MLDSTMRPVKDRLLAPVAHSPIGRLHPMILSALGLAVTIAAAAAAWQRLSALAVALCLVGRLADGLDGVAARATDRASDVGGLVDFCFDTIGYSAVPLGIALGLDDRATWIATAVLLATFYVNGTTLGYLAALREKRALGAAVQGQPTSAALPRGLVEGTETIVFFTVALAWPGTASVVWGVMAGAVALTVLERLGWAARTLR